MAYTKEQIAAKLYQYPAMLQQIKLLRFELEHPAMLSSEEVIEAMNFAHNTDGQPSSGAVSDKTLYIALNYHKVMRDEQDDTHTALLQRLHNLECETRKIRYYLSLLDQEGQTVIELLYFSRKSIPEAAKEIPASIWLVRKRRDEALRKLAEMYSFIDISAMDIEK